MSAQLAEAIFVFEMHWYWTVVVVINEKDKAQDLVYYLVYESAARRQCVRTTNPAASRSGEAAAELPGLKFNPRSRAAVSTTRR